MTTTTEQERAAYMAGDTKTADLLARIDALQRALDELEAELYMERYERAYRIAE